MRYLYNISDFLYIILDILDNIYLFYAKQISYILYNILYKMIDI